MVVLTCADEAYPITAMETKVARDNKIATWVESGPGPAPDSV